MKGMVSSNLMEGMIHDLNLRKIMEKSMMCTCDKCCTDVHALVLNNLPPKYIVSEIGEILTRYDLYGLQVQTDITVAIVNAIKIVAKNPKHENDKIQLLY